MSKMLWTWVAVWRLIFWEREMRETCNLYIRQLGRIFAKFRIFVNFGKQQLAAASNLTTGQNYNSFRFFSHSLSFIFTFLCFFLLQFWTHFIVSLEKSLFFATNVDWNKCSVTRCSNEKVAQIFPIVVQKVATLVLPKMDVFQNSPKHY